MGRMTANEIIPGRIYQRGHMLTWRHSRKEALLSAHGIDVVVNLWDKIDPDLSDLVNYYIYWPIKTNEIPSDCSMMVRYVAELINRGHTVLIHCESGVNRSMWFSGKVAEALDYSPERCLAPHRTKMNRVFIKNLSLGE